MRKLSFAVCRAANADVIQGLVFPVMDEFGPGLDREGSDRDLFDIGGRYGAAGGCRWAIIGPPALRWPILSIPK